MKLCIDPGHGFASKHPGRYDPGAVNGEFHEAVIVLRYAFALEDEAQRRGWPTFLTRRDNVTPAPLGQRVMSALIADCTMLISLHCDSVEWETATGVGTMYMDDRELAERIQVRVADAMGLRDRGVTHRPGLAVLRFPASALVELAFMSNPWDLAMLLKPEKPAQVATAICNAISHSLDG